MQSKNKSSPSSEKSKLDPLKEPLKRYSMLIKQRPWESFKVGILILMWFGLVLYIWLPADWIPGEKIYIGEIANTLTLFGSGILVALFYSVQKVKEEVQALQHTDEGVLIVSTKEDESLVNEIIERFKRSGINWMKPSMGASPRELCEQLKRCNGVVFIHSNSPLPWINAQVANCRRCLSECKSLKEEGVIIYSPSKDDQIQQGLDLPPFKVVKNPEELMTSLSVINEQQVKLILNQVRELCQRMSFKKPGD